jgi:hypothetical protein
MFCSGRTPLALQGTKPPPAVLSEYRDEEAIERRLLHREHILLMDPPPELGESPEFEYCGGTRNLFTGFNGSKCIVVREEDADLCNAAPKLDNDNKVSHFLMFPPPLAPCSPFGTSLIIPLPRTSCPFILIDGARLLQLESLFIRGTITEALAPAADTISANDFPHVPPLPAARTELLELPPISGISRVLSLPPPVPADDAAAVRVEDERRLTRDLRLGISSRSMRLRG